MSSFQAVVLGIIQGLTEFLPISSSGHLVLLPWLFGWEINPEIAFSFDVLVQWGTLAAVILYFRSDIAHLVTAAIRGMLRKDPWGEPEAKLAWLVALASIPAAAAGAAFRDLVASAFDNPAAASVFLLLTAALLVSGEKLHESRSNLDKLGVIDAIVIGTFQALALFPGVSRSGSTISAGLLRGLERKDAARFSFLMSIPIMLGAGMFTLADLPAAAASSHLPVLLLGTASAAVVGYLSIRWLLGFISTHRFTVFAWYCLAAGAGGLILYAFRA